MKVEVYLTNRPLTPEQRLWAVKLMQEDPEARECIERALGLEATHRAYPEVYATKKEYQSDLSRNDPQ